MVAYPLCFGIREVDGRKGKSHDLRISITQSGGKGARSRGVGSQHSQLQIR